LLNHTPQNYIPLDTRYSFSLNVYNCPDCRVESIKSLLSKHTFSTRAQSGVLYAHWTTVRIVRSHGSR